VVGGRARTSEGPGPGVSRVRRVRVKHNVGAPHLPLRRHVVSLVTSGRRTARTHSSCLVTPVRMFAIRERELPRTCEPARPG